MKERGVSKEAAKARGHTGLLWGGARHKAEEVGGCGQLSRRVWPYNLSLDPVAL